MKYSLALHFVACVTSSLLISAAPAKRGVSDPQVLNFALTLEHLEATFYKQGLDKFSADAFKAAGFSDWVRNRFEQIQAHEAEHVTFLSTALKSAGADAVAPCEYNFPMPDVHSFIATSMILEAVGSAAYTGGAQLISNKDYLTAAASILTVEGRHTAWINSAINKFSAWDTSFQTALNPNQIFTLASGFITSCPDSNAAALPPLKAYPALAVSPDAHPGKPTTLTFAAPTSYSTEKLFAAFISGIGAPIFVPVEKDNEVTVPDGLLGVVFCVITKDGEKVDDSTMVAGPAILNFQFDSMGNVA
ncbi:protein rds1 [Favolaschia claudopus]|uniref:Protein rds1 n=1 Tax=Favolaschia claudopus TaxID=2862362 RepID=A0AAW0AZD7_9AGAR